MRNIIPLTVIGLTIVNLYSPITIAQNATIIIDGDMTDWDGIPIALNDTSDQLPWINLNTVQITNDTDYLYFRMVYSNSTEYHILWANTTIRNLAGDVFVVMAFVSDGRMGDVTIFKGMNLTNPKNDPNALDPLDWNLNWSALDSSFMSIEFKIALASISSGNMSNTEQLDMIFWHYDTNPAGKTSPTQVWTDRAPDTGYFTYYLNGTGTPVTSSKNNSEQTTSSSTQQTTDTEETTSDNKETTTVQSTDVYFISLLPLFVALVIWRRANNNKTNYSKY